MAALRAQGVTDPAVLSAIEKTPRDLFTPDLFKERSWEDLGPADRLRPDHQPAVHRRPDDPGPEPGAALPGAGDRHRLGLPDRRPEAALSRLVYTIERYRTLMKEAEGRFAVLGLTNVITKFGDGGGGLAQTGAV